MAPNVSVHVEEDTQLLRRKEKAVCHLVLINLHLTFASIQILKSEATQKIGVI